MQRQILLSLAGQLVICGALIAGGFYVHPMAGYFAVAFSVLTAVYWIRQVVEIVSRNKQSRGRSLRTQEEVKRSADKRRVQQDKADEGILWGTVRIPTSEATGHFCVVGAVGSGKTLTIRMLMKDQLPHITSGSNRRALVYDAKQDMVAIVCSLKLSCPVYVLNPFDERATAWDMAKDIDSPATARQLAENLVPQSDKEQQPFFSNSVRELITAVLMVFLRTRPGAWTFRDLLLVVKSRELLRQVLGHHDFTKDAVTNFLEGGEETVGSIMATVATKLGPFEAIAAAWEHAANKISVKEWIESESILILGNDERVRKSLDTVNQLFVALCAQHVLAMPESTSCMTWFFFDEFREAGKLPGLESIILRGRSKGCCVVLGFQDIKGVEYVYKEGLGLELVGQCGNKAFLRIESPETAEWASRSVGEQEIIETNRSHSESRQGTSTSESYNKQTRSQVLASEFMELPTDIKANGLHGIYLVRSVGVFRGRYTPSEVNANVGTLQDNLKPFIAAPLDWQYLRGWTSDDSKRLGIDEEVRRPSHQHDGQKRGARLDDIDRVQR